MIKLFDLILNVVFLLLSLIFRSNIKDRVGVWLHHVDYRISSLVKSSLSHDVGAPQFTLR